MKKQDRNNALDKLNSIQRKLNYQGHQMTSYKQKQRVAYQIEKITYKALQQEHPESQDFKERIKNISHYEWAQITVNYIKICKQEIRMEYKLKKLYIKVKQMPDEEIIKPSKFYKTIKQIQKAKNEEIPEKLHIDEVMKYYSDIFQSKQIIEHKRNILQNLIATKETITYE